ncbi:MoaD/ThiS family protein [Vulcanisaeta sp. JCM 14467]|uniref:MoaD/ThiS family protein n=1 Tax=Vulcanisaeta sp. JCM 14467 TaxID=1295370 RepID=UPI0006D0A23C|nr:MoaD/ThiS family protein [Vulcanisaeta sp. JCM 14467]
MKIKVKFLTLLYEMTKTLNAEIELQEGATLLDLIRRIDDIIYPGFSKVILDCNNKIKEKFLVLINGRSPDFLNGVNTKLLDGDEVTFLPHCGVA